MVRNDLSGIDRRFGVTYAQLRLELSIVDDRSTRLDLSGRAAVSTIGAPVSVSVPDGIVLDARIHSPQQASATAAVVLVHGIGADLDEGGMYGRLAVRLADVGFGVLRFSFRGHGASTGTSRGATLAGEMLDVEAATAAARTRWPGVPLAVVASSLGAVSVIEAGTFIRPDALVLWNPVLDLRRTFVEPELPWGRENFAPEAWAAAERYGYLLLDGEFEVGRVLLAELRHYEPLTSLARLERTPTFIVHGDCDSAVSFDVASTFGPLTASRGAIRYSVAPWTPLLALHAALTDAARTVLGPRCVMDTATFRPHVSVAYAHTRLPAVAVVDQLRRWRTVAGPTVVVDTVDMVRLQRIGRSYRYDTITTVPLGAAVPPW